jgi:hypothetical protein
MARTESTMLDLGQKPPIFPYPMWFRVKLSLWRPFAVKTALLVIFLLVNIVPLLNTFKKNLPV